MGCGGHDQWSYLQIPQERRSLGSWEVSLGLHRSGPGLPGAQGEVAGLTQAGFQSVLFN